MPSWKPLPPPHPQWQWPSGVPGDFLSWPRGQPVLAQLCLVSRAAGSPVGELVWGEGQHHPSILDSCRIGDGGKSGSVPRPGSPLGTADVLCGRLSQALWGVEQLPHPRPLDARSSPPVRPPQMSPDISQCPSPRAWHWGGLLVCLLWAPSRAPIPVQPCLLLWDAASVPWSSIRQAQPGPRPSRAQPS